MRPLFPAWSNSVFRLSLGLAFFVLVSLPIFLMAWVRTPYATGQNDPVMQPIKFDHRHHVRDDGIDCKYCHTGVTRSAYAGVPATSVCMNCHSQIWPHSPETARLRDSYFQNEPIVWQRVNNLPQHVFFNHSAHVNKGVGCVTCHGRVDLMGQVLQAKSLSMHWCLDCHRNPAPNLRPLDHVTDMEWVPPGDPDVIGRELQARLNVHPPTDCSTCHR